MGYEKIKVRENPAQEIKCDGDRRWKGQDIVILGDERKGV